MHNSDQILYIRKQATDLLALKPRDIKHSQEMTRQLDVLFGFQTDQIEAGLLLREQKESMWETQPWIGLPEGVLQTPYHEFNEIIELVDPENNKCWTDLGCGYARLGLVLWLKRDESSFCGYELIEERFLEAKRVYRELGISVQNLYLADISIASFKVNTSDVYFIYDFGSRLAVQKILTELQSVALSKKIVVVARGRGVRHWIETGHPWLAEVNQPKYLKYVSVYWS